MIEQLDRSAGWIDQAAPADGAVRPASAGWARRCLIGFACLLGMAVNGYLNLPVLSHIIGGDNDFMGFYAGAKLAGSHELYSPGALARLEAPLWERPRFLAFVRLPFYALCIAPLRFFSYRHAFWLWQAASLAAVLLFIRLWPARAKWVTAVACCWSAPLLNCFIMGNDVTIVAMALAAAMALLLGGRHFLAGCVFALCLIKYNLFLSMPLLIVGKRLWRFGGGAVAGGSVLLALSFAAGGWQWPAQYAAILLRPTTTPNYQGMPNLRGLFSNLPYGIWLEAGAACLVLAAAWLAIRRSGMTRGIAAVLISGLLLSHHAFFADAFLLAPAALLLLQSETRTLLKALGVLLLCPLAYVPLVLQAPPVFSPAAVSLLLLLCAVVFREDRRNGKALAADIAGQ